MTASLAKKKAKKKRYYERHKTEIHKKNRTWAINNVERLRQYRKEYWARPEIQARRRQYYQDNKEHLKRRDRIHYYKTKDRHRELQMAKRYNISVEYYRELFKKQNNLCAICSNPETAIDKRSGNLRYLAVDHCHKTGEVRGLLCQSCNQAIGMLKENPILFDRAKEYLLNGKH